MDDFPKESYGMTFTSSHRPTDVLREQQSVSRSVHYSFYMYSVRTTCGSV